MTQVNSAQEYPRKLALRMRADHRSLAQRRADFAAQMREMAISDLTEVSDRLKGLCVELERREGRKWTDQELARAMDIPLRTFQSWQNGEVENRDGKGYDKMARFYSRKLGRKITRQWILFGDEPEEDAPSEPTEVAVAESPDEKLDLILSQQAELLGVLSEVRSEQESQRKLLERAGRGSAKARK